MTVIGGWMDVLRCETWLQIGFDRVAGCAVVPDARVDGKWRHGDPRWVIRRAGGHQAANGGQIMLGHAQNRQLTACFRV